MHYTQAQLLMRIVALLSDDDLEQLNVLLDEVPGTEIVEEVQRLTENHRPGVATILWGKPTK